MRIALASDHAGYVLKTVVAEHLVAAGHDVLDLGTDSADVSVDYPVYGLAAARAVVGGQADRGVCFCGTGIGIGIAANKVPGTRAATAHDVTTARLARQHNDANLLCLGGRVTGPAVALDAVDAFLATAFEGGRHVTRIAQIAAAEGPRTEGPRAADPRTADQERQPTP